MIKPCGYHVLIKMEEIKREIEEGALQGFVLDANEVEKEQAGHDIGVIEAFGPLAFKGFKSCDSPEQWGVAVGDRVEFNRYDGKVPSHPDYGQYRLIEDSKLIAKID